ncbi:uncharacterized protein, partial [Pyxicephalus adspersus]|uniref:uncharacterized protein n=1 Tax=Pyxicephalus adspersus TaxID=30357 RepID=UPI003B59D298
MDQLKRNLQENDGMAPGLQEQLLQKASEYEQLLQIKNKLEEDKSSLTCVVENLTSRMTETQINFESLQNEKHQTEEQILDLQQKLNRVIQDRDDLKSTHEKLISEIDQLKGKLKENDEMALQLKQDIHQRMGCQNEELEETQHTLKNDPKQTMKDLTRTETQLETLRSEKLDIEEKFLHLQHKMEKVTQEWEDLKASQEILILERDQLKEALDKNIEM